MLLTYIIEYINKMLLLSLLFIYAVSGFYIPTDSTHSVISPSHKLSIAFGSCYDDLKPEAHNPGNLFNSL